MPPPNAFGRRARRSRSSPSCIRNYLHRFLVCLRSNILFASLSAASASLSASVRSEDARSWKTSTIDLRTSLQSCALSATEAGDFSSRAGSFDVFEPARAEGGAIESYYWRCG